MCECTDKVLGGIKDPITCRIGGHQTHFFKNQIFSVPRIDDAEEASRDCRRHKENLDGLDERPLQMRPCSPRSAWCRLLHTVHDERIVLFLRQDGRRSCIACEGALPMLGNPLQLSRVS